MSSLVLAGTAIISLLSHIQPTKAGYEITTSANGNYKKIKYDYTVKNEACKDWDCREEFCASNFNGATQATIHSLEELEEASDLCTPITDNTYIGLIDADKDGNWLWADGSAMDYDWFLDGDADESVNGNNCAYFTWKDRPSYASITCGRQMHFLCNAFPSKTTPVDVEMCCAAQDPMSKKADTCKKVDDRTMDDQRKREVQCTLGLAKEYCHFIPCSEVGYCTDSDFEADYGVASTKEKKGGKKKGSKGGKGGKGSKSNCDSFVNEAECGGDLTCVWKAGYPPIEFNDEEEMFAVDVTIGSMENMDNDVLVMIVLACLFVSALMVGYKYYFGGNVAKKTVVTATEVTPLNV